MLRFRVFREEAQELFLQIRQVFRFQGAEPPVEVQQGDNSRLNIRNLNADKGLSNYNQPLNNTTSVVYDLPFGKGRKMANSSTALDYVIGGWRATLINTMTSGLPINLTYGAVSGFSVGGTATTRPNLTGQPLRSPGVDPNNYLDINGVSIPSGDQLFGNAGRNLLNAPGAWNIDMSVSRIFKFTERWNLETRTDAFNILNHANWNGNVNPANANNTAPVQSLASPLFGQITTFGPPRIIQLSMKLSF